MRSPNYTTRLEGSINLFGNLGLPISYVRAGRRVREPEDQAVQLIQVMGQSGALKQIQDDQDQGF